MGVIDYSIIGRRFGLIEVIGYHSSKFNGRYMMTYWTCRCNCGKEFIMSREHVIYRRKLPCGCKNTKLDIHPSVRREAIIAAKDLMYGEECIADLKYATTEREINSILTKARHGGYESNAC